jgi:hypothetical protein
MLIDRKYFPFTLGLLSAALLTANANANAEDLAFTEPQTLSANSAANKTKLVRMGDGWLVSVYGDATAGSQLVYDLKADDTRLSRDNFVKVCHPANNDSQCGLSSDWSAPVNISNTAHLSSIATNWDINSDVPSAFQGDAEKPNIFVAGNFAVVTWVSKYCPGGNQKLVSYNERDGISVPFSCVYTSYTNNVAGITDSVSGEHTAPIWNTIQITDGSRDAKSDSNKGLKFDTKGLWSIAWQEDPHGLQIGGSDGPGDGASGASVTHGTDVWYTFTDHIMETPFATPARISDNYTNDGSGGNTSPVFHPGDLDSEIESLQRGTTGAARPNLMLTGVFDDIGTPPTAVIAYEESKGSDRLDSGKYIRYHEFPFNQPPESGGIYQNGEPGCIISDPAENSRRVRFVSQHSTPSSGLRMGVFWKQGFPTQGGPSDIMVRVGNKTTDEGSTGLRPEDMTPAVDAGCRVSLYKDAQLLTNIPASNISTNTIPWSPVGGDNLAPDNVLADTTSKNPYEDARAHRAAIVGEDFYLGYSYAKDWAVATVIDLDNYNFWLRKFNGTDNDWTTAKNISNINDVTTHVKEPRLVKTPGTGMGCDSYAENCANKSTLIVAWGTESNVYQHIGGAKEGDIYYTRTRDKGETFEEPVVVPNIGDNDSRFESQLRPSPAGNTVWTVWNEGNDGGKHAVLSVSSESTDKPPLPPVGGITPPLPEPSDADVALASLDVPTRITANVLNEYEVNVEIINNGSTEGVSGTILVIRESSRGEVVEFTGSFSDLLAGTSANYNWVWNAPSQPTTFNWTATVTATEGDTNLGNNTASAITRVRR